VDRIAFCGQTSVNYMILPMKKDDGTIGITHKTLVSWDDYQKAVGKIIAVENDGRMRVIVKIV